MRSRGSGVAMRLFTITFWKGYGRDPVAIVGLAKSLMVIAVSTITH